MDMGFILSNCIIVFIDILLIQNRMQKDYCFNETLYMFSSIIPIINILILVLLLCMKK